MNKTISMDPILFATCTLIIVEYPVCISEQKSSDNNSFNLIMYKKIIIHLKKLIWFQYVLPRANSASSTEEEKEKSVLGSDKFENSMEAEVTDEDKEFCQLFCLPLSEVPLSGLTFCSNRANFTLCVCVCVCLLPFYTWNLFWSVF